MVLIGKADDKLFHCLFLFLAKLKRKFTLAKFCEFKCTVHCTDSYTVHCARTLGEPENPNIDKNMHKCKHCGKT